MISISRQDNPNKQELTSFLEKAFSVYNSAVEGSEDSQSLSEWFSVDEMIAYLDNGVLLEARKEEKLVGVIFSGKQSLLTWPDGNKAELFILAVDPDYRNQGIGKELVQKVEKYAKDFGAKSMIVNTHIDLASVQAFYEKLGYELMGVLTNYYDNGDAVFFKKQLTYS